MWNDVWNSIGMLSVGCVSAHRMPTAGFALKPMPAHMLYAFSNEGRESGKSGLSIGDAQVSALIVGSQSGADLVRISLNQAEADIGSRIRQPRHGLLRTGT
jgi:hypothetical protein